ncbi:MAG: cytochrome P450 [Stappiaceae bacterium]
MSSPAEARRLFGPHMLEDPFAVYRTMRENDPICWNETLKAWVVTRYSDVSKVLKDRRMSSNRVSSARLRYSEKYQSTFDLFARLMLQSDDPKHKRLRHLVHSAFTRTAVEGYEERIRHLCKGLLAPGLKTGEMEFVEEFAAPLPILVISKIVGIPTSERAKIKVWCDAFSTIALNFYVYISDEQLDECCAKIAEFHGYLKDKMEAARKAPGDDLISSLVVAADNENLLDIDELIANCMLLLNAGNETTTCLLANGLDLLLKNPNQMALLRADPTRIPGAIEEFLRLEGPVQFLGRVALEEIELGEERIGAGDMVIPVIAAANRDPMVFDNPDTLDIQRPHIHQLGFGTGPHLCAGIQLARFEAKVAFEVLLSSIGSIEAKAGEHLHAKNFNMRCLEKLPITVTP